MLSEANRELGLFDILINGIGSTVPAFLVPPLAFLLVGLTVFAVGGCWVVMTIAIPVFMTTAGTGVSNITVIKSTLLYAIGVSVLTIIGFLLCGLM